MKKLFYSLFILAMTAMTFTSCEDVPAPFDIPFSTADPNAETVEPAGSGTQADPYNVAAAIAFTQQLATNAESTQDIYIKGKVVSIDENYTTQYGNAKFYISDDGTANNRFLVYRALYLGNKKYTSGDVLNEGDEVIICGKVTNYNGTLETVQIKAFLYSLNGKTEGGGGSDTPAGDAKGSGTLADPYNPLGAAAAVKNLTWTSNDTYETTGDVYIKGKISRIADKGTFTDGGTYGNASFYISEDGTENGEFYCFRILYLGNKKFESGQTDIKVGDEVIVLGKLMNYRGNTPETVAGKAYLYSLNGKTEGGGGSDTPETPTDKGSYSNPYDVASAIAAGSGTGVYVKAYIVGYVEGQVLADGAHFTADGCNVKSNMLIAPSASETDLSKCMPVQLPSGEVRNGLNLQDNPGNIKKEVLLYGNIEKYFGAPGVKAVTYAEIDGKAVGSKP